VAAVLVGVCLLQPASKNNVAMPAQIRGRARLVSFRRSSSVVFRNLLILIVLLPLQVRFASLLPERVSQTSRVSGMETAIIEFTLHHGDNRGLELVIRRHGFFGSYQDAG
jgi:hypothetical protein